MVVILTELKPKDIRVNLRSQNDFDVAKLAQRFGGGGHTKAAGGKIQAPLSKAQKVVLSAIQEELK